MIILETDRLLFRDHEPEDLEAYCAMEADPVFRHYCGGTVHPREEVERNFRQVVLAPKPGRLRLWATEFKPEGRYIGRCGIYRHLGEDGVAIPGEGVLAYYLARDYWGQGLATEAGRAFIEYGFGELGLSRIVAGANVTNLASNRVLQKLGFVWIYTGEGGGSSYHDYELRNPSAGSTAGCG